MDPYPVEFSVQYPERPLDQLSTFFRLFTAIPILILLGSITGFTTTYEDIEGTSVTIAVGGVGLLFIPVLLMLLFRGRYPRWWFDWNLNLQRLLNRVGSTLALMDDRYPSTEDPQAVRLDYPYPDAEHELSRGLPLVKWLLALPHFFVLALLYLGVLFALIGAWFGILITGRYPRGLFDFVEGVLRWHNRVVGYAFVLVTDRYPPFRLKA